MVISENVLVLGQETYFLLLDYLHLDLFRLLFLLKLLGLDRALGFENREPFFPEAFDFAFVLTLTHAPLLCIHLFKAFVFRELSHQLRLELFFEALLFGGALGLKPELELLSELELFTDGLLALGLSLLLLDGGLLFLL